MKKGKPAVTDKARPGFPLMELSRFPEDLADLFSRERQERDVPAPLDGNGDLPLVAGAVAGDAAGEDLAALGDEKLQGLEVLVVDERRLIDAEPADLPSDLEPFFAVAAGARPAALGGPGT
jgi:hypothetical protein